MVKRMPFLELLHTDISTLSSKYAVSGAMSPLQIALVLQMQCKEMQEDRYLSQLPAMESQPLSLKGD
ncbi:hypothetical protein FPOAC1_001959 [Fusarium poae]|uniref:hypothetical protein n=1 Tax=Fusarium poae TaxID=36050 RepID=UPI001CEAC1E9|nr:hypothetical protein FPOAC1_001959 [Fusarium poae]KAG8675963.1 hypothetical protein FPOAC1_001959 [Fusarium poae]